MENNQQGYRETSRICLDQEKSRGFSKGQICKRERDKEMNYTIRVCLALSLSTITCFIGVMFLILSSAIAVKPAWEEIKEVSLLWNDTISSMIKKTKEKKWSSYDWIFHTKYNGHRHALRKLKVTSRCILNSLVCSS